MNPLIHQIDKVAVPFLRKWSTPALRASLALIFVWFGVLKIVGFSPVVELVAETVYWVDPTWFVAFLGVVEVLIGLGLALGRGLRLVLLVLSLLMVGTFLVFLILPEVVYQGGNPLRLTTEGAYIVKNLVLLAAAMVIGAHLGDAREEFDADQAMSGSSL